MNETEWQYYYWILLFIASTTGLRSEFGAKFGLLFVFIANMLHLKPKLSSNPSHSENSNPQIHTTLTLATLTLSLAHTHTLTA